MIRSLLRLIGVIFLAAGFILLMYDGAKSIADSRIYIYKLGQLWTDIHVASLQSAQAKVQASLPAMVVGSRDHDDPRSALLADFRLDRCRSSSCWAESASR